MYATKTLKAL